MNGLLLPPLKFFLSTLSVRYFSSATETLHYFRAIFLPVFFALTGFSRRETPLKQKETEKPAYEQR